MKTPRSVEVAPVGDPDAPELPTEPSTDERPPSWPDPPRPGRLIRRALPVLAVCALIAWSLSRLLAVDHDAERHLLPPPTALASMDAPVDAAVPVPEPHVDEGLGELPGTELRKFLATKVERLVGGTSVIEPIKSSIHPRTVSLVNLWASWCEPCKSELPRLRAFFLEHRRGLQWGSSIQFVAVMVDDGMTAHAASRGFEAMMPADTVFLVDRNLDGGVKEALGAVGMKPSQLPVTLLLDCHRRVRWHRVGALEELDLLAIAKQIEVLRDEDACRKPRPVDISAVAPEPGPQLSHTEHTTGSEPEAAGTGTGQALAPEVASAELTLETRAVATAPRRVAKEPSPAAVAGHCDLNRAGSCGDGCRNRGEDCKSCPEDVQCGDKEECLPRGDQAPGCVALESIGAEL